MHGRNDTHRSSSHPSLDECQEELQRVLRSSVFRNATTLQMLLQFLSHRTLSGGAEDLKEYTIGIEALGRRPDFDPKTDPIVRVQSHRLRLKLRDYYDGEGAADPILIQLLKGRYTTSFVSKAISLEESHDAIPVQEPELRLTASERFAELPDRVSPENSTDRPQPTATRSWWRSGPLTIAVAVVVLFTAAFLLGERHGESGASLQVGMTTASAEVRGRRPIVETLWAGWVGDDPAPVIAYTDAVFLLDDSNDLFRYRRGAIDNRGALVDPHLAQDFASNPAIIAHAGALYYENGYTGTGELEAAATLAGLLRHMGLRPVVKSSRDISPSDLSDHTVILLGSPFQNDAVAQLPIEGDFVFENPDQRHEQWRGQILNKNPRAGEAAVYRTERDDASKVLKADYSLITVLPGRIPSRRIIILGGLDTKGTEGAAMLVTTTAGVTRLQALLGGDNTLEPRTSHAPHSFQALVRVSLAKGYQVIGVDLIAVHELPTQALGSGIGGSSQN